jgi:hypothetical protein
VQAVFKSILIDADGPMHMYQGASTASRMNIQLRQQIFTSSYIGIDSVGNFVAKGMNLETYVHALADTNESCISDYMGAELSEITSPDGPYSHVCLVCLHTDACMVQGRNIACL